MASRARTAVDANWRQLQRDLLSSRLRPRGGATAFLSVTATRTLAKVSVQYFTVGTYYKIFLHNKRLKVGMYYTIIQQQDTSTILIQSYETLHKREAVLCTSCLHYK